jgi:protein subunit release factor A
MKNRELQITVKIEDCKVDTFTVGGHGGSGKDTSNTGVRITHEPSGAVGKATDSRSQGQNKILAFRRMGESQAFRNWARTEVRRILIGKTIEQEVEEMMKPENLLVEVRTESGWKQLL